MNEPSGSKNIDTNVPRSQVLHRIRTKLDRLRATDGDYRVFGANGHRYREVPVLDDDQIHQLEEALGGALPEELGAFLQHVHGGGPGPGYGLQLEVDLACPELAGRPFPYDNQAAVEFLERKRSKGAAFLPLAPEVNSDNGWPPRRGFVGLAHLGCDIYSGIVVTGDQRGLIWTCGDIGWVPEVKTDQPTGFLEWYEAWLDNGLAKQGSR